MWKECLLGSNSHPPLQQLLGMKHSISPRFGIPPSPIQMKRTHRDTRSRALQKAAEERTQGSRQPSMSARRKSTSGRRHKLSPQRNIRSTPPLFLAYRTLISSPLSWNAMLRNLPTRGEAMQVKHRQHHSVFPAKGGEPGFPRGASLVVQGQRVCLQCRRCGFDPRLRRISSRRKWQSIPAFWPGESHGQMRLAGYSPGGRRVSAGPNKRDRLWKSRKHTGGGKNAPSEAGGGKAWAVLPLGHPHCPDT